MPTDNQSYVEGSEFDAISSILNGPPFKIRSDQEKSGILEKGRPMPKLSIIKRDSIRNCNRTFQPSWYSIHKWLCGSNKYNKLFCWPCVLMRPETSSWCSTGNDDMKRFTSLATKHSSCKSHLKAISEYDETLQSFGLTPEFVNELNVKCKDEEVISDETDGEDDLFDACFNEDKLKGKKNTTETCVTVQTNSASADSTENNEMPEPKKPKNRITFKAWKEMSNERLASTRSQLNEDYKMIKWRRKIAKQELKNARLTGEKLKFEIEVLKAKAEYYLLLKDEISVSNSIDNALPVPELLPR